MVIILVFDVSCCLQIEGAYHMDGLEVLKGSRLLRTSARAVKTHSQSADVFQSAVALLNMLLTEYKSSSCFDVLVEELLDSNFALEVEIAARERLQVSTRACHSICIDAVVSSKSSSAISA